MPQPKYNTCRAIRSALGAAAARGGVRICEPACGIRVRVVHEDWDPKCMKVHTIARYVQTKEGPLVEDEKISALSLSACHTVFKLLVMNLQISLPIYPRPQETR